MITRSADAITLKTGADRIRLCTHENDFARARLQRRLEKNVFFCDRVFKTSALAKYSKLLVKTVGIPMLNFPEKLGDIRDRLVRVYRFVELQPGYDLAHGSGFQVRLPGPFKKVRSGNNGGHDDYDEPENRISRHEPGLHTKE